MASKKPPEGLFHRLRQFDDDSRLPIFISRTADRTGNPTSKASLDANDVDTEKLQSLWTECLPFLGKDSEAGMADFLASRVQLLQEGSRQRAVVTNVGDVLIEAMLQRKPYLLAPIPANASCEQLDYVANLAAYLAEQFCKAVIELREKRHSLATERDFRRLEQSGTFRRLGNSNQESRDEEWRIVRAEYRTAEQSLERHRRDAEIVAHYTKLLLPEEWASCEQISGGKWRRADSEALDLSAFAKEMRSLEAKFAVLAAEKVPSTDKPKSKNRATSKSESKSHRKKAPKRTKPKNGMSNTETKWLAGLSLHHKYDGSCCGCFDPIGVNDLAAQAEIGSASASRFFERRFRSHKNYIIACRTKRVFDMLKLLNGDIDSRVLLGDSAEAVADDD